MHAGRVNNPCCPAVTAAANWSACASIVLSCQPSGNAGDVAGSASTSHGLEVPGTSADSAGFGSSMHALRVAWHAYGDFNAVSPALGTRLLFFENYAHYQRPLDILLKAIAKAPFWQDFGLAVQAWALPCFCRLTSTILPRQVQEFCCAADGGALLVQIQDVTKQDDGSALLSFTPASTGISGRMQLIAVHMVSSHAEVKRNKKSGRPVGLSQQLEARSRHLPLAHIPVCVMASWRHGLSMSK